jgi:PKHD-type hydroxylase
MVPILPLNTPGRDAFAYWENFFTPEQIDTIANLPVWDQAEDAFIGGKGILNPKVRRTKTSWLAYNDETSWIWDNIINAISKVNNQFFQFNLTGCYEEIQLGIYSEENEGHYNWHIDADVLSAKAPRKLSMALLLSDPAEFEGGQLQLKVNNDEPISVQQAKGRAWFFPSYTLHRVTPVTKGVRKSLVVWAGGPQFK